MATRKQIAANQANSRNSTGPHDTTRTRHNATRHGLVAEGLTDLDRKHFDNVFAELLEEYEPVGRAEVECVSQMGLAMVRLARLAGIESFAWAYLPERSRDRLALDGTGDVLAKLPQEASEAGEADPNANVWIVKASDIQRLESTVGRYQSRLLRQLYQAKHELERSQLRRQGELVPAPLVADINVYPADEPEPAHQEHIQLTAEAVPLDEGDSCGTSESEQMREGKPEEKQDGS